MSPLLKGWGSEPYAFTDAHVGDLMTRSHESLTREEVLLELVRLHEQVADDDAAAAEEVRRAFLLTLREGPCTPLAEKIALFYVDEVQPSDYAGIQWQTPAQVIHCWEALSSLQTASEMIEERIEAQVVELLRHALRDFDRRGESRKMTELLQIVPVWLAVVEDELLRLRNRAVVAERRRAQRVRFLLHGYLVLYVLSIVGIFPWLFIHAENGALQRTVEEDTELVLSDLPHRYFSYADGLYWSLTTATGIGYGDITPATEMGQWIAIIMGIMRIASVTVVVSLFLHWITTRRMGAISLAG